MNKNVGIGGDYMSIRRHSGRSKTARIKQVIPLYYQYIDNNGTVDGVHKWIAKELNISESTSAECVSLYHRLNAIGEDTGTDVWKVVVNERWTSNEMRMFIDRYNVDELKNKEDSISIIKFREKLKMFEDIARRKSNNVRDKIICQLSESELDETEQDTIFKDAFKCEMLNWIKSVEKEYGDIIEYKYKKGESLYSSRPAEK